MKSELEYEFKEDTYYSYTNRRDISVLVGQTLKDVTVSEDMEEVVFKTEEGYTYKMYHSQDCCETVSIEDICGDLQDLIGQKIEVAEERESEEIQPWETEEDGYSRESFTWTFYCIRCVKTSVDIRWYGSSNGYYSERVDFERIT